MNTKTERFEMRLDPDTITSLDNWRSNQDDIPSRAEAIRRLVDIGLRTKSKDQINFSDGEKLIIHMLCDIHKNSKINGEIDPEFVQDSLFGGHHWGLDWKYTGMFHNEIDDKRIVSEVVDILDMWYFIENGYKKLSKKDKEKIKKDAHPFGEHVYFPGFDGNNEIDHMSIARFLIYKLERFTAFKDRNLNSHMPSLEIYRRMLKVFEPMRSSLAGGELNTAQLIKILKSKTYPK